MLDHDIIIDTSSRQLYETLSGSVRYEVPRFQRDYSWGKEQCEELYDDILDLRKSNGSHFIGQLVLRPKERNLLELIDGQQRLTTVTLITLAAAMKIKHEVEQNKDVKDNENRRIICNGYIRTIDPATLENQPRLVLSHRNNAYFQKLMRDLKVSKPTEHKMTNNRIHAALEFFIDKFARKSCLEIMKIIKLIFNQFLVTVIKVDSMTSAFYVFESLNSKGAPLQVPDLVKNLLMEKLVRKTRLEKSVENRLAEVDGQWDQVVETVGSSELSSYLRSVEMLHSNGNIILMKKLFAHVDKRVTGTKHAKEYLDEIVRYADIYSVIRGARIDEWKHREEDFSGALHTFQAMRIFNIRLPISMLIAAAERFNKADFETLVEDLFAVVFRYNVVCNKPSRDMEKKYASLTKEILDGKLDVAGVLRGFAKFYPADDEFEKAFETLTVPQQRKAAYFLQEIEKVAGENEPENAKVSFVIPTNANGYWEERFGPDSLSDLTYNLANCCLDNVANATNSYENFDQFKERHENSGFFINRKIASNSVWDIGTYGEHRRWLANQAASVWKLKSGVH